MHSQVQVPIHENTKKCAVIINFVIISLKTIFVVNNGQKLELALT